MTTNSIIHSIAVCAAAVLVSLPALAGIPRPEYPRPQFERADWINLNGEWTYSFDFSDSGMDRNFFESEGFDDRIIVPFAPQCELSGVNFKDFIPEMWYQRTIRIPADWAGRRILLNFGAVDYIATIYVDGQLAGRHWGGSSSFSVDITKFVSAGSDHSLVVRVEDNERGGEYAHGKQAEKFASYGCMYTRTTGIWQTVWLEPVAATGLKDAYIIPDLDQSRFIVEPRYYAQAEGQQLRIRVKDGDRTVSEKTITASEQGRAELAVENVKTWSPEDPFLYGIELDVLNADGEVIDHVDSYAGMRKISIVGNKIYLNNEPRYLRFVLDQGFYPEGTWTAPSDEALRHDIEMSMAAGFNGARLHQKMFEPRFHYWADRLGYLTWAECASWGANVNRVGTARNFIPEWEETVIRDRNHPSIIAWTPFNEAWEMPVDPEEAREARRFVTDVYNLTKALDYRPCHDVSGGVHVVTDIYTIHQYEQNPEKFRAWLAPKDGRLPMFDPKRDVEHEGQPYLVDEYGGIKWIVGQANSEISWGYGEGPKTLDEFYERLEALTDVILDYGDEVCGYCYTQLTDVEQEQNGIYNYDRSLKFDMSRISAIFSKIPAGYR
ncbi:MAG: beta-glucuronidase [Bacteroidales bacterium]|nr:beta-glucuronidase [Bacteroidales bacterium]